MHCSVRHEVEEMLQLFAVLCQLAVDKGYTAAAAAADELRCRHDINLQSCVQSVVAIT